MGSDPRQLGSVQHGPHMKKHALSKSLKGGKHTVNEEGVFSS